MEHRYQFDTRTMTSSHSHVRYYFRLMSPEASPKQASDVYYYVAAAPRISPAEMQTLEACPWMLTAASIRQATSIRRGDAARPHPMCLLSPLSPLSSPLFYSVLSCGYWTTTTWSSCGVHTIDPMMAYMYHVVGCAYAYGDPAPLKRSCPTPETRCSWALAALGPWLPLAVPRICFE